MCPSYQELVCHHQKMVELQLKAEEDSVSRQNPEESSFELSLVKSEPVTEEEGFDGRAGRPEGDPHYTVEE